MLYRLCVHLCLSGVNSSRYITLRAPSVSFERYASLVRVCVKFFLGVFRAIKRQCVCFERTQCSMKPWEKVSIWPQERQRERKRWGEAIRGSVHGLVEWSDGVEEKKWSGGEEQKSGNAERAEESMTPNQRMLVRETVWETNTQRVKGKINDSLCFSDWSRSWVS